MSQRSVERALGRLVTDPAFRRRFFCDPEQACLEVGVTLTAEEMDALGRVPPGALERLEAHVDDRLCRLHVPDEAAEQAEWQR